MHGSGKPCESFRRTNGGSQSREPFQRNKHLHQQLEILPEAFFAPSSAHLLRRMHVPFVISELKVLLTRDLSAVLRADTDTDTVIASVRTWVRTKWFVSF